MINFIKLMTLFYAHPSFIYNYLEIRLRRSQAAVRRGFICMGYTYEYMCVCLCKNYDQYMIDKLTRVEMEWT